MARTPDIDRETYALAMTYGYTLNIGQVTPTQQKALDRQVRQGEVRKVKALFPYLLSGCSRPKMCYVNTK